MFPAQVSAILTRLEQAGFPAYAVGGCVRDTLLGRTPEDWDVTTAARPEQTAALFAGHSIPTGLRHGTVTVRQDGLSVEVTTFRADGPYSDHRRPDAVYFSDSLAEELCRRLRMDKRTAHEIVTLVQWHDRDIPRTERAIARAVHQLGEDTFRRLLAIKRADNLAQHPAYRGRLTELDRAEAILDALLAKQACFSLRDLAVDGRDMLALGLRGPAVGHTLDALLAQVLDGALPNDRAALLAAARKTIP